MLCQQRSVGQFTTIHTPVLRSKTRSVQLGYHYSFGWKHQLTCSFQFALTSRTGQVQFRYSSEKSTEGLFFRFGLLLTYKQTRASHKLLCCVLHCYWWCLHRNDSLEFHSKVQCTRIKLEGPKGLSLLEHVMKADPAPPVLASFSLPVSYLPHNLAVSKHR